MIPRLLPGLLAAAFLTGTANQLAAQNTIADRVVAASGGAAAGTLDDNWNDYDILLTALNAAGLTAAVADPGVSLTVFAPSDRAFLRLARDLGYTGADEQGTWQFLVDALTALGGGDPIPTLTNILKYHVAPTRLTLLDVIVRTVFGDDISTLLPGATIRPFFFALIDNEPDLRNPLVRAPRNVSASNGIVHSLDRVLIPVDLP